MGRRILVFGAGGHAVVVIDALERCGTPPVGVYDDNAGLWGGLRLGYPIVGGKNKLFAMVDAETAVVVAIARNDARSRIVREFQEKGIRLIGVHHPKTTVSPRAELAETVHLLAGVVVNAGARIEEHAVLNTASVIEHDCEIGPFVHVGPGAHLAGAVRIQEGAFIGTAACILPMMTIGSWATVGAGGVVTKDVADRTTVVGVPARTVR